MRIPIMQWHNEICDFKQEGAWAWYLGRQKYSDNCLIRHISRLVQSLQYSINIRVSIGVVKRWRYHRILSKNQEEVWPISHMWHGQYGGLNGNLPTRNISNIGLLLIFRGAKWMKIILIILIHEMIQWNLYENWTFFQKTGANLRHFTILGSRSSLMSCIVHRVVSYFWHYSLFQRLIGA